MISKPLALLAALAVTLTPLTHAAAAPASLTIHVDQPSHAISPTLYGMMTEEINYAYDGGLYAELIRNRDFSAKADSPVHWSPVLQAGASGTIALDTDAPQNTALTKSLLIDVTAAALGQSAGAANEGYWGIPVWPHTAYRASLYAKSDGVSTGPLTLSLESADGSQVYATASVGPLTNTWAKYSVTLKTGDASVSLSNRFVVYSGHPGKIWITLVSLFPPTFNNRPNGNRIDLMQKLAALNPSFLRLPGGNYLEGNSISTRFDWKNTLHDVSQRPGHHPGCWGYPSTDGMGLLEMLEWCEDLHIQPVLGVFAGMALDHKPIFAGPALQPYVVDALDEIEYVTGPVTSQWGAVRASDGHPKPFALKYVEIGNEDWFDKTGSYDGRYAQFYTGIKAKYPQLQLIATMPVKSVTPDIVDDHYYRSAVSMEADSGHYDGYSRSGPKIFVGEWATVEGSPTPTMNAALGDAAWMTGMERNSDLIVLASYAPLLVNVHQSQWGTNLIGYDALHSFGSPSYYAQAMFGWNRGDVELPVEIDASQPASPPGGAIGIGTWQTQAQFKDVSVTSGASTLYETDFSAGANDWQLKGGAWQASGGALSQSSGDTNCFATTGNPAWSDYTYSLKAMKTGGKEGFLVMFHVKDSANLLWWNIGGWGNTRTAIEETAGGRKFTIGPPVSLTVDADRWYDIKIDVKGKHVSCYLDGKLLEEADEQPSANLGPIFASASLDRARHEVILKTVNVSAGAVPLTLNFGGAVAISPDAKGEILTGEPGDQNFDRGARKVAPKPLDIATASKSFVYNFPAHSISVVRFKLN